MELLHKCIPHSHCYFFPTFQFPYLSLSQLVIYFSESSLRTVKILFCLASDHYTYKFHSLPTSRQPLTVNYEISALWPAIFRSFVEETMKRENSFFQWQRKIFHSHGNLACIFRDWSISSWTNSVVKRGRRKRGATRVAEVSAAAQRQGQMQVNLL